MAEDKVKFKRHPEYDQFLWTWRMVRDCNDGESVIKSANTIYLPMPEAMAETGDPTYKQEVSSGSPIYAANKPSLSNGMDPNYHANGAYRAYKTRASFPGIVNHTIRGLLGLALRNLPTVKLPDQMQYLMKDCGYGYGLIDFYYYTIEEVIKTGRFIPLVDIASDGKLKFVPYLAEGMINWKSVDNELTEALFIEDRNDDDFVDDDEEDKEVNLYAKVVNGVYKIERYEDGEYINTYTPSYLGKTMDKIPAIVIGSTDISPHTDKIPLESISKASIQIYQLDADLRQAEYMTCNPTLVITGVDEESAPSVLGSTVAILLPEYTSKAYYTETDTSALNLVRQHIQDLHEFALQQGASLLGGDKDVAESGEALRLRQEAASATLTSIVHNIGRGFDKILKIMAEWMDLDSDSVEFEPSKEFTTYSLTPNQMQSFILGWKEGVIPTRTIVDNFKRAGLVPQGITREEEIVAINERVAEIEALKQKAESVVVSETPEPKENNDNEGIEGEVDKDKDEDVLQNN